MYFLLKFGPFSYCIKFYGFVSTHIIFFFFGIIEGRSRGSFLSKILVLHQVMKKLSVNHGALYIVKGDNTLICRFMATLVLLVLMNLLCQGRWGDPTSYCSRSCFSSSPRSCFSSSPTSCCPRGCFSFCWKQHRQ